MIFLLASKSFYGMQTINIIIICCRHVLIFRVRLATQKETEGHCTGFGSPVRFKINAGSSIPGQKHFHKLKWQD